jgi:peptide/nickel transport system ATP-binding protein
VAASAIAASPKVELRDVNLRYFGLEGETEALKGISIAVAPGEFVAIIGQSGCGKSTLLSLISGILMPTGGAVLVDGKPVTGPSRKVGYMLQQDYLFEWRTILENAVLGAEIQGADMAKARERARGLLTRYGLGEFLHHLPRQLSGGMRQRVAIAIALLNRPKLIIADEPTTALDVTIQAQILYEVQKVCRELGTAMIWITHDLAVVSGLADRIAVMYAGRIVESAEAVDVIGRPCHPYTQGLISSIPTRATHGSLLRQIPGMTPSLLHLPRGCAFRPRCGYATDACLNEPQAVEIVPGRTIRCWNPLTAE